MNTGLIGLPTGRRPLPDPFIPGQRTARGSYWGWGWPAIIPNATSASTTPTAGYTYIAPFYAPRPFRVRSLMFHVQTGSGSATTATAGLVALSGGNEPAPATATDSAEIRCTQLVSVSMSTQYAGAIVSNLPQDLHLPAGEYATMWYAGLGSVPYYVVAACDTYWGLAESLVAWPTAWRVSGAPTQQFNVASAGTGTYTLSHIVALRWRWDD